MAGTTSRWAMVVGATGMLLAGPALAQERPTYKCVTAAGVTYSEIPCRGARELGATASRATERHREVPQDRAVIARRARLTGEEREECRSLDARMKEQQAQVKAKGDTVTLQDEMPLVRSKARYRELKC